MKILITGAAGYIGTKLIPMLLRQGHSLFVVDNFDIGYHTLLPYISDDRLTIYQQSITDEGADWSFIEDVDAIVHLAAVVGFPACEKDPEKATQINLDATKFLIDRKPESTSFVFASTCSNYGHRGTDIPCDEDTPLQPLSTYGRNKTEAEAYTLTKPRSTALRLATAFGIAPRLRVDLLANRLVIDALSEGALSLYEAHHRRSFIHIVDIARSFIFALENIDLMSGQAFNVGDFRLNYTKAELGDLISKLTNCKVETSEGRDMDQRDYVIDFSKINRLGFSCEVSMEDGLREVVNAVSILKTTGEFEKFEELYANV